MLDHIAIYDALYGLVAGDGREEALFGDCQPLAREALRRSLLASGPFPILWFELPFLGRPRFDLHVAHARDALVPGSAFSPGAGCGHEAYLDWFCREEKGGYGTGFSFDVSDGDIETPSVTVNVNNAPLSDMARFFELTADADAARTYERFVARLPEGWRVWYAGTHPRRPGSPVRVDCFADPELKAAYAADLGLLERDLLSCGVEAGAGLAAIARPILDSPFELELQFDAMRDGTTGPTLGLSAYFSLDAAAHDRQLLKPGGALTQLLERLEDMGLADGRHRELAGTVVATAIPMREGLLSLYCLPTFVKLRMRGGEPLDAKAYLQAGARLRTGATAHEPRGK